MKRWSEPAAVESKHWCSLWQQDQQFFILWTKILFFEHVNDFWFCRVSVILFRPVLEVIKYKIERNKR
jgi:hypothetical protein